MRSRSKTGKLSDASSGPLMRAGIAFRGEFWTRDTSECPKDVVVSSLWAALEQRVPSKYFITAKASAGILERIARYGKALPTDMHKAMVARSAVMAI